MKIFIEVEETYNPSTGEGEHRKFINVDHIIHISDWLLSAKKRNESNNARILLSNNELLDTNNSVAELIGRIEISQKVIFIDRNGFLDKKKIEKLKEEEIKKLKEKKKKD